MSLRLVGRLAFAVITDIGHLLTDWAVGPQCGACGDRFRGPRTLGRHIDLDHTRDDRRVGT